MSDLALFFNPLTQGYSEILTYHRSLLKYDNGGFDFYPVQDAGGAINEWAKYKVTAQYKLINKKDSTTLEQLLIKGIRDEVWVPLWWSKMQLDGTHSSGISSFTVKDATDLGNTKVDYTEFLGTRWGFTNAPRSNVKLFLCKVSDSYTWELLPISGITSPSTILSSGTSSNAYVDEDFAVPAIKCKLSKTNTFSNKFGFITDVSITSEEV